MPNSLTQKFICKKCNFNCSKQSNYQAHLLTRKHNTYIDTSNNARVNTPVCEYICKCGNAYKHRQSLHTHRKSCIFINNTSDCTDNTDITRVEHIAPPVDMNVVLELLKQNQEFKELIVEQNKQMVELVKNTGNTTNNTTNNNTNNNCNNKFNLNFFLNETCKDAITLDDFINTFQVTRDEFIHTGNVGFIEGISTVMLNRFRDMDMHTRPLHCTDLKRETVYIKNADKWEKEDNNKTHLRRAVKGVANKNMKELWRWYNDSKPEVEQIGSDECENYFKYYKAALGGCGKDEDLKFEDKIIKNVLKEVQVDKTALTVL